MISTREEAELMFRKWMENSSTIFFTAFRPDRTVASSFYGKMTAVSQNMVAIAGEQYKAELDLEESQFAFVTESDLPAEARQQLDSSFDSGVFISQADGSTFAFIEVDEQ